MRRIRIALFVLSLALLVPLALLAWRALDGLALERSVRHRAVAERAFDEMERSLSDFLAREEARPFEAYRFYVSGPGDRSPLSRPEGLEDFVVGAFQRGPDGRIETPFEPRDLEAARVRGDWPPGPEVRAAISEVKAVVAGAFFAGADAVSGERSLRRRDAASKGKAAFSPGTTRALADGFAAAAEAPAAEPAEPSGRASAYEVLQSFNRGAEDRAERKQKVQTARLPRSLAAPSPPEPSADAQLVPSLAEESSVPEQRERESRIAAPLRALGYVVSEAERFDDPRREDLAKQAEGADEVDALALALDPMVGRPTGERYLLLYRTVLLGEQGFRQGLLLDRARLLAWLDRSVLRAGRLSQLATLRSDGGPVARDFAFEHRFAEPFDGLHARLELDALPGLAGPGAIYGLVALVLLIGTAGLFAIHRMVAVVVQFAERRNNFVAAVTHELKTPLTAIRMYGEMLRDDLVPTEAKRREYVGTISDESERLSRLIDNVLEFSRLERGRRELSLRVGAVAPVLEEATRKLRTHAEREGFALALAVEPGLPPIRFDRDALLQVLFNLVDNAMKYAAGSSPREVVLEARRRDGAVEIAVRDHGPGVSSRHQKRIFEPFYRGEDELTRSAKGTGIGLALVKELAERMGAAVRGSNDPGGGFRVCLAFPAVDPA
jgi:signal transduction histidine kinase